MGDYKNLLEYIDIEPFPAEKSFIDKPLPKKTFIKFHGNYCGPGNQGGQPKDDLDTCCMLHDKGYYNDKENEIMYDRMLCLRALEIAKDSDYSNHIRLKAMAIAKFFMKKIKKNGGSVEI